MRGFAIALGFCAVLWPQHAADERVVSLIPSVTEMLFAIGAGPQVVGVSSFDKVPADVNTRTRVGGLIDPDIERIITLRPTLVVIYETQIDLRDKLASAGIRILPYRHGSVADMYETIRGLGVALGRGPDADQLIARIHGQIANVQKVLAGQALVRTLFVIGREPGSLRNLDVAGGEGFLNEVVELAGGVNVFRDVARPAVDASTEQVLARRPEAILEIWVNRTLDDAARAREVNAWRGLPGIPAVRDHRIYEVADERPVVPGPRLPDGITLLAHLLHPSVRW